MFLAAGGERFQLIPCLNDSDAWVRAMAGYGYYTLLASHSNAPGIICQSARPNDR